MILILLSGILSGIRVQACPAPELATWLRKTGWTSCGGVGARRRGQDEGGEAGRKEAPLSEHSKLNLETLTWQEGNSTEGLQI